MKLPDYYEFQSAAKIMSGKFALENIPQEMRNLHAVHPMILSDNMLEKIGTLQKVLDALAAQGMEAGAIYTDIPADSSLHVVNGIAKEFKRKNCDSLIAVGGGSVIDTAKGVRMLLSQDMDDILEVWGCEKCGQVFCSKCFIDRYGFASYMEMMQDFDLILCPDCYEKEKESKEAIRLAPLSIMLEMKNTEIGTHRLSYPLLSQGISGSKESTSSSSNGAGLSISSSMPLSRAISFCSSHILQI